MIKRSLALFSLFLGVLHSGAVTAAQVTMNEVFIQTREVAPGRISFEYCEGGFCRPMGRPEGYSKEHFRTMREACERRSNLFPFGSKIFKGAAIALAVAASGGVGLAIGIGGTAAIGAVFDSHDFAADAMASDLIEGLSRDAETQFEFSRDDFNHLYDGLISCHRLYDLTPGVWLQDCENDLACKRALVPEMDYSDSQLEARSAYELFSIKMELQKNSML